MKIIDCVRQAIELPVAGLALSAIFVSCAPQVFTMNIEMRHSSASGLDLMGKSVSVVYLDDLSGKDSVFSEHLANGFASELEKDYFDGKSVINIYRMPKDMAGNYASRDTLRNLVMDTGNDLVFLFDSPWFGNAEFSEKKASGIKKADSARVVSAKIPMTIRLYTYDSMNKADTVQVFKGMTTARETVYVPAGADEVEMEERLWNQLAQTGESTGKRSATSFLSTWYSEQFPFIYYDSDAAWATASQYAYEYKWKEAISKWIEVLDSKNIEKRACAEYNIAVACYLLGDNKLARQWLDKSDKDYKTSLSDNLRMKIEARSR